MGYNVLVDTSVLGLQTRKRADSLGLAEARKAPFGYKLKKLLFFAIWEPLPCFLIGHSLSLPPNSWPHFPAPRNRHLTLKELRPGIKRMPKGQSADLCPDYGGDFKGGCHPSQSIQRPPACTLLRSPLVVFSEPWVALTPAMTPGKRHPPPTLPSPRLRVPI